MPETADQHGLPLPDYILDDLNVVRDWGTPRARALVAIIDGLVGREPEANPDVVAGLEVLAEKFDRPVQVFLWDRNQDRVKLIRTALRLLSPEADHDG